MYHFLPDRLDRWWDWYVDDQLWDAQALEYVACVEAQRSTAEARP